MWSNFLWVGLGGFAGSAARYAISAALAAMGSATRFPVATLAVNVAGSFLIGWLLRYVEQGSASHLLAVVGFCGGFTTFSTFSFESVRMFKNGQTGLAVTYMALSLLLCLGATVLGMTIKITR